MLKAGNIFSWYKAISTFQNTSQTVQPRGKRGLTKIALFNFCVVETYTCLRGTEENVAFLNWIVMLAQGQINLETSCSDPGLQNRQWQSLANSQQPLVPASPVSHPGCRTRCALSQEEPAAGKALFSCLRCPVWGQQLGRNLNTDIIK